MKLKVIFIWGLAFLIASDGFGWAQRLNTSSSSKKSSSSKSYSTKSSSKKKPSSAKKSTKSYSTKSSKKSKSVGGGCAATTNKGTACKRAPQEGSDYCWQHTKMYGSKEEDEDKEKSDDEEN